jgi:hypothetical protein
MPANQMPVRHESVFQNSFLLYACHPNACLKKMSVRQMVFRTEYTEPNALAYYTEESITAKKGLKGRVQDRPKEIIEGNKRQVLSRFQILIFF